MIGVDHSTTDEAYVHDLNGNRKLSGAVNWKTDADNRISRDGVYGYTYDKEGNRTKRVALDVSGVANGATTEYAWDHRNRLTTVTEKPSPGGGATRIIKYEYDAFDRRIAKSLDSDANGSSNRNEFYIWSGDDVIFDFVDPDGVGAQPAALSKRYLWGEAVDQLLAQEDVSTGVSWALGDHLNTTRDLVDNAGAVQTHYKYDAFGNLKAGDATKTRFLYTSQEYDPDTGLVYYNARWYDPRSGTFLSQDSWGFAAGDENLTRYVGNSPTNWVDPTGHVPIGGDTLLPPREQEPIGELPPTVPNDPPSLTPGPGLLPPDFDFGETASGTGGLVDGMTPEQFEQLSKEEERKRTTVVAVIPVSAGTQGMALALKNAKTPEERAAIAADFAERHMRYMAMLEFERLTAGRDSWECGYIWQQIKDTFRVDYGYDLLVLFEDGHQEIIIGAEPSTGDYAEAFAAWLAFAQASTHGAREVCKEAAEEVREKLSRR